MPTVLIADDSATLRRIVSSVLTREAFDVVLAEDGLGAVRETFRTMPDVLVLDVAMPRLSGYVVTRLLKDDWRVRDIPVILLTSLDTPSDRYWGAQTGAERFLTKDFQAPQLVSAVREVIDNAATQRAGAPPVPTESIELSDDDVLSRVSDLLDRRLFETQVAADVTALATTTHGFEMTVAAVLDILKRFVDYDLATVLMFEEQTAYIGVGQPTAHQQYVQCLSAGAEALSATTGVVVDVSTLELRIADPDQLLGEDEDTPMETYVSLPLRSHGGRVIGLIGLSAGRPDAFGDRALTTLRLIEDPAAIVLDNARLAAIRDAIAADPAVPPPTAAGAGTPPAGSAGSAGTPQGSLG